MCSHISFDCSHNSNVLPLRNLNELSRQICFHFSLQEFSIPLPFFLLILVPLLLFQTLSSCLSLPSLRLLIFHVNQFFLLSPFCNCSPSACLRIFATTFIVGPVLPVSSTLHGSVRWIEVAAVRGSRQVTRYKRRDWKTLKIIRLRGWKR